MAGHIRRRGERWRARHPNPFKGGTAQVERTFRTKREAEHWLDEMKHAQRSGTYPDPRDADRRFTEVVTEWRHTWRDLEPKTRAGYDSILNLHLLPAFGGAKLSAVSTAKVDEFVQGLAARRQPNTVRRVYTVLRQVLALAVERRYLAVNPCDGVRLPRKRQTGGRKARLYLTSPEVRALADIIEPHYRVAVYVAAYCGLRAGELWDLQRRDVNLLRSTLTVERTLREISTTSDALAADEKGLRLAPTKTDTQRTMALPGFLREMLGAHLASCGTDPEAPLFATARGSLVRHGLFYRRVFRPAVMTALPERLHALRWHDLRHKGAVRGKIDVAQSLESAHHRLARRPVRSRHAARAVIQRSRAPI